MKKNHTLLYLLDTTQQQKGDLIWFDEGFHEFEDVIKYLEQLEEEPDPDVVERILKYAASS
jgi:hypothetical protein